MIQRRFASLNNITERSINNNNSQSTILNPLITTTTTTATVTNDIDIGEAVEQALVDEILDGEDTLLVSEDIIESSNVVTTSATSSTTIENQRR